ncbi:MAG TPA: hypothetical protein VKU60_13625 [Chloroflexota bacterium]|nr:hypothetical protein [Chloroflexota bacterium]
MPDTYNSVVDRIGAFNAATESMSKSRGKEVRIVVAGGCTLRLSRTAENYAIELSGAPAEAAAALQPFGFSWHGDLYMREVRKSERSWNVASLLEDVLQEGLQLASDVTITVEMVD